MLSGCQLRGCSNLYATIEISMLCCPTDFSKVGGKFVSNEEVL